MVGSAGKSYYVRGIFDRISSRYDLMNKVMSLGFENVWRRKAAQLCGVSSGSLCLDVCTGSGMLALELAKLLHLGGRVYAVDFSPRMLSLARSRLSKTPYLGLVEFIEGDALNLPFKDEVFDCTTAAFCLRNVEDVVVTLREMVRVTKRGGRVVVLDLSKPPNRFYRRLYDIYLKAVVPVLGRIIVGESDPYAYMHTSLMEFPVREELAEIMSKAGLDNVRYYELNLGAIAIHVGVKRGSTS